MSIEVFLNFKQPIRKQCVQYSHDRQIHAILVADFKFTTTTWNKILSAKQTTKQQLNIRLFIYYFVFICFCFFCFFCFRYLKLQHPSRIHFSIDRTLCRCCRPFSFSSWVFLNSGKKKRKKRTESTSHTATKRRETTEERFKRTKNC